MRFRSFLLWLLASSLAIPAFAEVPAAELERYIDDIFALRSGGAGNLEELVQRGASLADRYLESGQDSLAVVSLGRRGDLQLNSGRLDDARVTYERCIDIAVPLGLREDELKCRSNLANIAGMSGDFEGMIERLGPMVSLARELGVQDVQRRNWFNIGVAYTQLGRLPEASAAIEKSLALLRPEDGKGALVSGLTMVSELNVQTQQWDLARDFADSAVNVGRDADAPLPYSAALMVRGLLLSREGDLEAAIESVDEAIAVRRRAGYDLYVPIGLSTRARLQTLEGHYEEALESIAELDPLLEGSQDPTLVLAADLWRGLSLVGLGRKAEAEATLLELMRNYESTIDSLESDASAGGLYTLGGEAYGALAGLLVEDGDVESAWAIVERGSAPYLRKSLGHDEPASFDEVQAVLREQNAMLLQYSDSSKLNTQLFVLDGHSLRSFELERAGELEVRTQAALKVLESSTSAAEVDAALTPLTGALLAGVASDLESAAAAGKHLYLVIPSVLSGFPVEALPVGSQGERLGEAFPLSYLPAATLLVGEASTTSNRVLALADPLLSDREGALPEGITSSFRQAREIPLPHAREEVGVFGGETAEVWMGADASKERLLGNLQPAPAVLHFATHAVVSAPSPQNSCLLLAGEDGMLRSGEVEELALGETDLVTLSACRTNGGFVTMGEGVFSLSRSFLRAGAHSVVSSLWDVDDRATSILMRAFYDGLGEGLARDEALRRARVAAREAGVSLRDRSAFVLSGVGALEVPSLVGKVTAPSSGAPVPPWLVGGGIAALIAVLVGVTRRRG